MKTRRFVGLIFLVVSSALSWYAIRWMARALGAEDPAATATVLLVAVLVHEFGHWAVFESRGIPTHMFFLVFLGGAMPDPKFHDKVKEMSWSDTARLALAGVGMNILVAVGVIISWFLGYVDDTGMHRFVNLTGGLVVVNMIPFGVLDGGRFAKAFFDSVPEWKDGFFASKINAVVLGVLFITLIFGRPSPISAALMVQGIGSKSRTDDPRGSTNPKAMTASEQSIWAVIYGVIIATGMMMQGFTKYVL